MASAAAVTAPTRGEQARSASRIAPATRAKSATKAASAAKAKPAVKAASAAKAKLVVKAASVAKAKPVAKATSVVKSGLHGAHRTSERTEELVSAAWKIFRAKGLRATRLEDVAHEAGVAKTLVYHYFASKEDLLYAAFEAQVVRFRSDLEARLANFEGDSRSALRLAMTAHWDRWLRDPDWGCLQRLLAEELANNPVFARRWGGARSFRGKILEDIIRRGQEVGEFDPALDPGVAREFIFSSLLQQALFQLHRGPAAAKALEGSIDLALRSLRPAVAVKPLPAPKRAPRRAGKP